MNVPTPALRAAAGTPKEIGTCCVVLHTHLPWLAHAGAWPVGEEWLHQAWATAYLPLVRLLDDLADEGRRDVLTLGVTPVVNAMLDDPYLLREFHDWLGNWELRSWELAARPGLAHLAPTEHRAATTALADFESRWRHGGSPVLRRLADAGVVELLGGPATHPFLPMYDDRFVDAQLGTGLDDAALRLGARPRGIWAPECGYRPGIETRYAAAGVERFVADGPTLLRSGRPTSAAWTVGDSGVVVFGRDLEVTYRVWSPRAGYPGGRWYRDFHTFDHPTGFRAFRVTSRRSPDKRPYDPARAAAAVEADALDFVSVVRDRLRDNDGGLVVVAYDTELFGHWWHEGPAWLGRVLRLLPEAGVRVTTLRGALDHVAGPVELRPGSWGSGKDFHVWENDLTAEAREVASDLLDLVGKLAPPGSPRLPALDQAAREAFLATASDWAFMVSKGSAPGFARARHATHRDRFRALADLLRSRSPRAARTAAELRVVDGPFGSLDARGIAAILASREEP